MAALINANYAFDGGVKETGYMLTRQTIHKAVQVFMDDWNYGDTPSELMITCTSQSDGTQMVEYKAKGEDDSAYSITKPTDAGDYVVHVIYDE